MQPLKPEVVDRILSQRPDVTRDHVREYQKLLNDWLNVNPHRAKTEAETAEHAQRIARLNELHEKLFGDTNVQATGDHAPEN